MSIISVNILFCSFLFSLHCDQSHYSNAKNLISVFTGMGFLLILRNKLFIQKMN